MTHCELLDAVGGSDRPAVAIPDLPLHGWQQLDWRFLLPPGDLAQVACDEGVPESVVTGLALLGAEVHRVCRPEQWPQLARRCEVVLLAGPTPAELAAAVAALRPGGWIHVEFRRGRPWSRGPGTLPGWRRALERAGLRDVTAYWHVPNLATCSRIVPLDASGAMRAALRRHQGIRGGLLLSWLARVALRLGLIGFAIPEGSLVGRRADPEQAPVG